MTMGGGIMSSRPDRDAWHLAGCQWLSQMADCTRRKVGAIVIDTDKRIAGAGYNGTRPGEEGCLDGACPRGRHYQVDGDLVTEDCTRCFHERRHHPQCPNRVGNACACGNPWPCPDAVAPGSSYDTGPGTCIATHAEMNAIWDVDDKSRLKGGTLYVSHEPCEGCIRFIRNRTPLSAVIWPEGAVALP